MLTRTSDRKTCTTANAKGDRPAIANAFGLPAGITCPFQTATCGNVCYAAGIERYPFVSRLLHRNLDALKATDLDGMTALISTMLDDFTADCTRRNAQPMIFRIHWDGDFFSTDYAKAWLAAVESHQDITFWVYTRNPEAVHVLLRDPLPNLAVYFSADQDNWEHAAALRGMYGTAIRLAVLARTFDAARSMYREQFGRPLAACPEQTGQIPLIDADGGACAKCRLCVYGKADVAFAYGK